MKEIRYGVVGAGYFGAGLARILNDLEGAKVTTIYDPEDRSKLAKELNCDVSQSVEQLCSRKDVDAVIVASPNSEHKLPVIEAAKNNKHVFCEKPIALNFKDCQDMIDVTKQKDVIFMAGHIMHFMNGVRRAKKMINDGVIGDILFCHAERNGWEDAQDTISWKKIRSKSGGHLYHHIHELDFIQFLMGVPERVNMMGGNVAHQGEQFGDEEDMLFISLEFPNKRFATLQYGSAFRWPTHFVRIQGTKGSILIDMQEARFVLKTPDDEKVFILHESKEEDEDRARSNKGSEMDGSIMYGRPSLDPPKWLHSMMINEMVYFHQIMQGGEVVDEFKPLLDGTAARDSIATADALTLSLQEGRRVSVKEVL